MYVQKMPNYLKAAILVDKDGKGSVHQVQVYVFQLQIFQRLFNGRLHLVRAVG